MRTIAALAIVLGLTGECLLTGCVATSSAKPGFANSADNVHKGAAVLPEDVRRVAVLPLATVGDAQASDGCETLSPVLFEELAKTKKFETVRVSERTMKEISGAADWTGSETLPPNFLQTLKDVVDCDAVMFCELTVFRPYAPIAIGWRLKLVDTRTKQILWAVDETFDTAELSKATETRHWMHEALAGFYQSPREDWTELHSPARVGRNSVANLLATLPGRQ